MIAGTSTLSSSVLLSSSALPILSFSVSVSGRFLLLYNVSQQKHYLQIHPVQLSDSGTYKCVAINIVTGKKVSSPNIVKLNVLGK